MRKLSLVVLDEMDRIIDRWNFAPHETVELEGFGFKLNIEVITGTVSDYITRITHEKLPKKGNFIFKGNSQNAYQNALALKKWLFKNTFNIMALEYNNTVKTQYCECKITTFDIAEIGNANILKVPFILQPLTHLFVPEENGVEISYTSPGYGYPNGYPYGYAEGAIINNEIVNEYIEEIPLRIRIDGYTVNPIILLEDENERRYTQVEFQNLTILEDDYLIIDSIKQTIKLYRANGQIVDAYDFLKKGYNPVTERNYQSFLLAKPLQTSKIGINILPGQSGKLTSSRRKYE